MWFADRATSCMSKAATEHAGNVTASLFARAAQGENSQCIIHFFGGEMTTASFAMYTFSLAVFVQALSLICFSSVADYGKNCILYSIIRRLTRSRKLSQEPACRLWLYWCHNLDAVSLRHPQNIFSWASLGNHRSHVPWVVLCHFELILTSPRLESPTRS